MSCVVFLILFTYLFIFAFLVNMEIMLVKQEFFVFYSCFPVEIAWPNYERCISGTPGTESFMRPC